MRVLHVVPLLNLNLGGVSQVIPELADGLTKQGVVVEIATMGSENQSKDYLTNARHGNLSSLTKWLWRNVETFDLVHLHAVFSPSISVAGRIARFKKVPYVITPHGMLDSWSLAYKSWKKTPYLKFVERATLDNAAGIHALTAEEKGQIFGLDLRAPVFIIPNGIHVKEFTDLPSAETFTDCYPATKNKKLLLFMGRIDHKKGLDYLISAYAKLRSEGHGADWGVVVAGPDLVGYRAQIENLVRTEKVESAVTFTGMLSGEMKLAALAAAHLFVLPSRSEGFSIAVLEAMAAKCPVIITEACNFPEVGKAEAGIIIKNDADQLSSALAGLFSNSSELRRMGENGCRLVNEKFTWSRSTADLKNVYADILAGRQVAPAWTTS